MRHVIAVLALSLLVACGGSSKEPEPSNQNSAETAVEEQAPAPEAETIVAVDLAARKVSCGCVIEEIGTCGNFVEIDGAFAPLANSEELGLGKMEWCGQEGLTAESAGELRDGEYHAETLVVLSSE